MATTQITLGYPAGTNLFTETALGNTALTVKGSSATVNMVDIDNTANAATSFVKLYNSAGAVTVGTTVPDEVYQIPASTRIALLFTSGKVFGTGLQAACVTAGGTAGTTSPTSAVIVRIVYA